MASQKMARPKTKGIMASMMVVVVMMMMMIMVLMTEGVRAEENSVQRLPPDSLDMRDGQKFAYVTLLYNDGVLEGARVLGHSLVKTGTPFDRVAIVTETCSPVSVDQLQMDGWLIHRVGNMPNPHQGHHLFQKRLDMVFSKLHIYNLTSYDKIVYLDTDILVLENVDELFGCPGFCANVRNGFFNTGVMVIRPSEEMFLDLVSQSGSLPSYNGGEQGLMNSYFPDFDRACPMFRDETGDDQRPTGIGAIRGVGSGTREALRGQKCARLPAYYNGDIGPYYLHNARWNLPDAKTSPKILHFTLGHFKPWQWWAFVPFDVFWIWHDVHTQLPPRLPHFRSDLDRLFDFLDFLIPPALTALVLFLFSSSSLLHRFNSSLASRLVALSSPSSSSSSSSSSSGSTGGQPMELGGGFTVVAMVYQFGLAFVSVGVPFMITFPKEFYHPLWGWLLTFEWFVLMLVLLYGHMLRVLYLMGVRLGQRAAKYNEALRVWSSPSETSEALIRRTVTLFMIMVFYLVVVCVDLNQSHPGNLGGRFLHTYIESGLLVIYLSALMSWLPRSWVHQGRLDSLDLSKAIQLPLFSSSLLYPLS